MKALFGYVVSGICGALVVLAFQGAVNVPVGATPSDGVADDHKFWSAP
jgi:hypothetical protein